MMKSGEKMISQFLIYLTLSLNNTETGITQKVQWSVIVNDHDNEFVLSQINTDGGSYSGTFEALVFKIEKEEESTPVDPVVDISSLNVTDSSEKQEIVDYYGSSSESDLTYSSGSENEQRQS
jgi:hypothetical protein